MGRMASPTIRMTMSVALPGPNGTITLIGLLGYLSSPCAGLPVVKATSVSSSSLNRAMAFLPLRSSAPLPARGDSVSGKCPGRGCTSGRPEHGLGGFPQNCVLLRGSDGQGADRQHGVGHAHVERVIAAEEDAVGPRATDKKFERVLRMHD